MTGLYVMHVVLQNSWGVCFLLLRRMDYGVNVLVGLDVLLAVMLVSVSTMNAFAAILCLPYFCWLLELTYLNMYMWRNNAQGISKADVVAMHSTSRIVDVDDDDESESMSRAYAGVREVPTGPSRDTDLKRD